MARHAPQPDDLDGNKSPETLGQEYERYIGYLLESEGWRVIYCGARKGKTDSGIDLICSKGNRRLLVQCKRWSKRKQIGIDRLEAFLQSIRRYKEKNHPKGQMGFKLLGANDLAIGARMYATTTFETGFERRAVIEKITCFESFSYTSKYPMIKCHQLRKTKQDLYYLPSDYGYDSVRMNLSDGDLYVWTEEDALARGFAKAPQRANP